LDQGRLFDDIEPKPKKRKLRRRATRRPPPKDLSLPAPLPFSFDGPEFSAPFDEKRLTGQMLRIWGLMKDGAWRTLNEIRLITGDPPASISAQLRHLRKRRFGRHTVNRRARGERLHGLFEYQVIVNDGNGSMGGHDGTKAHSERDNQSGRCLGQFGSIDNFRH
jgi:hypothetical protein